MSVLPTSVPQLSPGTHLGVHLYLFIFMGFRFTESSRIYYFFPPLPPSLYDRPRVLRSGSTPLTAISSLILTVGGLRNLLIPSGVSGLCDLLETLYGARAPARRHGGLGTASGSTLPDGSAPRAVWAVMAIAARLAQEPVAAARTSRCERTSHARLYFPWARGGGLHPGGRTEIRAGGRAGGAATSVGPTVPTSPA